ncbi:MAG: 2-C-methyl-D-erythritol 4-phosphate cytidylyltransferase [Oscillospiraceae bacterium]|nr:2-C-methyl-D-erythritol 4-phosphate cytidylyltransferase [Oscillospiraceae bacterium]
MEQNCVAVIVAAGTAQRMQGIDKMLAPLSGEPVLLRSFRALAKSGKIRRIYLVTREDLLGEVEALCGKEEKFAGAVCGGSSRAESVLRGLGAAEEAELIAIHDGARPLATVALIDAAIDAAARYGAAAPAIPVHDTIKRVKDGFVQETPDRSSLYAVQTPQVFAQPLIVSALCTAMEQGIPLTDDCSAVEAMGKPVFLTPGSPENLKITVPSDLILAEAIIKEREGL